MCEMLKNLSSNLGSKPGFRRRNVCFCGVSASNRSLHCEWWFDINREGTCCCRIFNFGNQQVNHFVPDGLQEQLTQLWKQCFLFLKAICSTLAWKNWGEVRFPLSVNSSSIYLNFSYYSLIPPIYQTQVHLVIFLWSSELNVLHHFELSGFYFLLILATRRTLQLCTLFWTAYKNKPADLYFLSFLPD